MNQRKVVLCDIDHVISNAFPRDHLIGGEGGWDFYHAESLSDEPIHDLVALINALHSQGFIVIGITARPEKWRSLTLQWLVKHGVMMEEILMRPDNAFHPAPEIKLKLALDRFADIKNEVALVLDDRDDVIAAFMQLGVSCLRVHGRKQ